MTSRPDRHGWNSWDQYQNVHEHHMGLFNGFVVEDDLVPVPTETEVNWNGRILCEDGFSLAVLKIQEVNVRHGRPWVRTVIYSYQGLQRVGNATRKLFRYDNFHPHPGHADAHHKHRCDADGNEIDPPDPVGAAHWPTLSAALEELRQMWLFWRQNND
jgi:Family of unknown function (DUF6516)